MYGRSNSRLTCLKAVHGNMHAVAIVAYYIMAVSYSLKIFVALALPSADNEFITTLGTKTIEHF
jgi:hypothetical protein